MKPAEPSADELASGLIKVAMNDALVRVPRSDKVTRGCLYCAAWSGRTHEDDCPGVAYLDARQADRERRVVASGPAGGGRYTWNELKNRVERTG